MNSCTAVLMAGGKSTRMGIDKARLDYHGRPLWRFQLEKLRAVAGEVFISARQNSAPFPGSACPVIFDEITDAGPLAGLHRALQVASFDRVLILAVDMPAMTSAFLESLINEASPQIGVIPESGGFYQGLAAVYPRALLPLVEEMLAGEDRSFQNLAREGIARGLLKPRPIRADEESLFQNWNRPEDRR